MSGQFTQINLFDVFCGTGVYDNGKKGSPIEAFESVKSFREEYPKMAVDVSLFVNDSASEKVDAVRAYIDSANQNHCRVTYTTNPAEASFQEIVAILSTQHGRTRNLVFVDPYGYKVIDREALEAILRNGRTELIMFLPISSMRRFTSAIDKDEAPFMPLKRFVRSFFPSGHPIHTTTLSHEEYVRAVKDAVSFGSYYSTSFEIERDSSNRYALFFVSPNIYGFEKILEVKWQMDKDAGRGFYQPERTPSLFPEQEREIARVENYRRLEKLLRSFLSVSRNNNELYEFVLKNEFLPAHANQIFRDWQSDGIIDVVDPDSGSPLRKGTFYLTWESYKDSIPKAIFRLIQR